MNITPKTVTPLDSLFGSTEHLLPAEADIPKEFFKFNNKWNQLANTVFFKGLDSSILTPKKGIDKTQALLHIRSVLRSFEPSHEHKAAGAAYLFSEWF
jgi:hypothetical protein